MPPTRFPAPQFFLASQWLARGIPSHQLRAILRLPGELRPDALRSFSSLPTPHARHVDDDTLALSDAFLDLPGEPAANNAGLSWLSANEEQGEAVPIVQSQSSDVVVRKAVQGIVLGDQAMNHLIQNLKLSRPWDSPNWSSRERYRELNKNKSHWLREERKLSRERRNCHLIIADEHQTERKKKKLKEEVIALTQRIDELHSLRILAARLARDRNKKPGRTSSIPHTDAASGTFSQREALEPDDRIQRTRSRPTEKGLSVESWGGILSSPKERTELIQVRLADLDRTLDTTRDQGSAALDIKEQAQELEDDIRTSEEEARSDDLSTSRGEAGKLKSEHKDEANNSRFAQNVPIRRYFIENVPVRRYFSKNGKKNAQLRRDRRRSMSAASEQRVNRHTADDIYKKDDAATSKDGIVKEATRSARQRGWAESNQAQVQSVKKPNTLLGLKAQIEELKVLVQSLIPHQVLIPPSPTSRPTSAQAAYESQRVAQRSQKDVKKQGRGTIPWLPSSTPKISTTDSSPMAKEEEVPFFPRSEVGVSKLDLADSKSDKPIRAAPVQKVLDESLLSTTNYTSQHTSHWDSIRKVPDEQLLSSADGMSQRSAPAIPMWRPESEPSRSKRLQENIQIQTRPTSTLREKSITETQPLSLFEELFPEEAPKQPEKLPNTQGKAIPRLPLPHSEATSNQAFTRRRVVEPESRRPSRAQGRSKMPRQREEQSLAVLQIREVSKSLTIDDFRRAMPKGKHIEEWSAHKEFTKVIPKRNPWTLEHLGEYYILFPDRPSALAYKAHIGHVYNLARQHTQTSLESPLPPPPGYLIDGEDVHTLVSNFTLLSPSQGLVIHEDPPPWNRPKTNLIKRGGYPQIIGSGHDTHATQVLLEMVHGHQPNWYQIDDAVKLDGKRRNLVWKLLPGDQGIRKVDMAKPSLSGEDAVHSDEEGTTGETPRERAANRAVTPKYGQRWILAFVDREEARRFARRWDRRLFPWKNPGEVKEGFERSTMVKAEVLW